MRISLFWSEWRCFIYNFNSFPLGPSTLRLQQCRVHQRGLERYQDALWQYKSQGSNESWSVWPRFQIGVSRHRWDNYYTSTDDVVIKAGRSRMNYYFTYAKVHYCLLLHWPKHYYLVLKIGLKEVILSPTKVTRLSQFNDTGFWRKPPEGLAFWRHIKKMRGGRRGGGGGAFFTADWINLISFISYSLEMEKISFFSILTWWQIYDRNLEFSMLLNQSTFRPNIKSMAKVHNCLNFWAKYPGLRIIRSLCLK